MNLLRNGGAIEDQKSIIEQLRKQVKELQENPEMGKFVYKKFCDAFIQWCSNPSGGTSHSQLIN